MTIWDCKGLFNPRNIVEEYNSSSESREDEDGETNDTFVGTEGRRLRLSTKIYGYG